ncbi:MAG: hypothetical protein FWD74_09100 [Actinomycetia bacterium]|nr:hypothetical protein [Actinomycetes bacterium]
MTRDAGAPGRGSARAQGRAGVTEREPCLRCGASDDRHAWVEGDCALPHRGHARASSGRACETCVRRHRSWLREVVGLYATLDLVVGLGSVPDDTPAHARTRRSGSPALVRLDAWAMLRDRGRLFRTGDEADLPDVPAEIADYADRLCDDLYGCDRGGWALSSAAAFLIAHAEGVARSSWVEEYDAELGHILRRLRRAHGVADPRPIGRCPSLDGAGRECGGPLWPELGVGPSASSVVCGRCLRRYGAGYLLHLGRTLQA